MTTALKFPSVTNSLRRQGGLTLVGFMVYVVFGASLLLVALRVAPIYMENMKLKSILDEVGESFATESSAASKTSIKQKLIKRFTINSVNAIKIKDIEIERDGDFWVVDAGYEKRVNLVRNIDIVVDFHQDNKVQIPYSR